MIIYIIYFQQCRDIGVTIKLRSIFLVSYQKVHSWKLISWISINILRIVSNKYLELRRFLVVSRHLRPFPFKNSKDALGVFFQSMTLLAIPIFPCFSFFTKLNVSFLIWILQIWETAICKNFNISIGCCYFF